MFRGKASALAAVVALLWLSAPPALARDRVPLPKPRPAEAPQLDDERAAARPESDAPQAEAAQPSPPGFSATESSPMAPSPSEPRPPQPKPASACRLALTDAIAIAPSIPDITGPGSCGGSDLVRLEAVVLPDGGRVAVTPAAILRCPMAAELAAWIRADIAPLAAALQSRLAALDNFDSYECRGRNRVRGAKLSEHGRANALDVRGLKLADGRMLSLTDRATSREVRESVLQSVCARFSTVLGPGSDGYHEDHIHLDLAQRRGGYKMCQWAVWEQLPAIAPLLPAERPAEAPPREVAVERPQDGAGEPAQGASPEQATPEQGEPESAERAAQPEPSPPATRKTKAKPKKPRGERQSELR